MTRSGVRCLRRRTSKVIPTTRLGPYQLAFCESRHIRAKQSWGLTAIMALYLRRGTQVPTSISMYICHIPWYDSDCIYDMICILICSCWGLWWPRPWPEVAPCIYGGFQLGIHNGTRWWTDRVGMPHGLMCVVFCPDHAHGAPESLALKSFEVGKGLDFDVLWAFDPKDGLRRIAFGGLGPEFLSTCARRPCRHVERAAGDCGLPVV